MAFFPTHAAFARLSLSLRAMPRRMLHRLSDTLGYGNLNGPLDLIIVQSLTFLLMSGLGYLVLEFSGAPFSEETRRTACLYLPAIAAPLPGVLLNNLHRFKIAMDHLLLTGDILQRHPSLSVPQAWRIGSYLMRRIKEAVGYNWRPACQYMKGEYPVLLAEVVERVRACNLPAIFGNVVE